MVIADLGGDGVVRFSIEPGPESPLRDGMAMTLAALRVRALARHLPRLTTKHRVDLYMATLVRTLLRSGCVVRDHIAGEVLVLRTQEDLATAVAAGANL